MAGAFEPEVLEAGIGLAAEVRAALVQRPDVDAAALARRVGAGHEFLARRVDQDHVGLGRAVVGREPVLDRQARVLGLDVSEGPDQYLALVAGRDRRPDEPDRARPELGQEERHPDPKGRAQDLPPRDALDLLLAEGLDRLFREGLWPAGGLDLVVAHRGASRWSFTGCKGARR